MLTDVGRKEDKTLAGLAFVSVVARNVLAVDLVLNPNARRALVGRVRLTGAAGRKVCDYVNPLAFQPVTVCGQRVKSRYEGSVVPLRLALAFAFAALLAGLVVPVEPLPFAALVVVPFLVVRLARSGSVLSARTMEMFSDFGT